MKAGQAALLAQLRCSIRQLEGFGTGSGGGIRLGVAAIDAALPTEGLPVRCLHEIGATRPGDEGAATAFAAVVLGLAAGSGSVLWVSPQPVVYPPGLLAYGLAPARLIHVRVRKAAEGLWAMEEGLRCRGLGAVLGENLEADLTASRRLQLAAEAGGVTGCLLQAAGRGSTAASAAVTRWRVASAPGLPVSDPSSTESELGAPCWQLDLIRCRGGRPGTWLVTWENGRVHPVGEAERERAIPRAAMGI